MFWARPRNLEVAGQSRDSILRYSRRRSHALYRDSGPVQCYGTGGPPKQRLHEPLGSKPRVDCLRRGRLCAGARERPLSRATSTLPNGAGEGQLRQAPQGHAVSNGRTRRRQVLEPVRSARWRREGGGRGFPGSLEGRANRSERRRLIHLQMACDQRSRGPVQRRDPQGGPRRPGRHLHGRTEARLLKRNRNDGMGGDVSG